MRCKHGDNILRLLLVIKTKTKMANMKNSFFVFNLPNMHNLLASLQR